jgi:hypothetical protein
VGREPAEPALGGLHVLCTVLHGGRAALSQALLHPILATVKHRLPLDLDTRHLLVVGVDETCDDPHAVQKMCGVSKHHNHAAKPG